MWSVQTGVSLTITGEVCVQEGPALTFPGQWVPKRTLTTMRLLEEPALQEDTQRGQAVTRAELLGTQELFSTN